MAQRLSERQPCSRNASIITMVEHTVRGVPEDSSSTASQAVAKSAVLPDPAYEFSAPRFYDFATNSQDLPSSERADAWFDTAGTASRPAFGCNTALTVVFGLILTLRRFNAAESQISAKQAAQGQTAAEAALVETSELVDMVSATNTFSLLSLNLACASLLCVVGYRQSGESA